MQRPKRTKTRLMGAAAKLALLFGGLTVALRFAPSPPANVDRGVTERDSTGRGEPTGGPSRSARVQGHETEDARAGTLVKLVLLLFSCAAAAGFGMWGFGRYLESVQGNGGPPLTVQQTTHVQPPEPTMQADPIGDIADLRARENALLNTYGWIDPGHTHARIPIDRAMSLVVGKSLDSVP